MKKFNLVKARNFVTSLPRAIKVLIVIIFDLLACFFSSALFLSIFSTSLSTITLIDWLWLSLVSIVLATPVLLFNGLYDEIFRHVGISSYLRVAKSFIYYAIVLIFVFWIFGSWNTYKAGWILQPIFIFIGIIFIRYTIKILLSENIFSKISRKNTIIYGAGKAGRELLAGININREIIVRAFIDDDPDLQGKTINGVRIYSIGELNLIANKFEISEILLAIPSVDPIRRAEIINAVGVFGFKVRTLPAIADVLSGRVNAFDLFELDINDLLGRKVVPPDLSLLRKNIEYVTVMITGAGGSIGSELCRQVLQLNPAHLILVDSSEHALYSINEELLKSNFLSTKSDIGVVGHNTCAISPCLASVCDIDAMRAVFREFKPQTVYHAAAYKHVPLVEINQEEGIKNNLYGTKICADLSLEFKVNFFTLISTDKAVRPTNVMGASKRMAEMYLQALNHAEKIRNENDTIFSMVRFGNVLGSSGSVVPLFNSQIKSGGPITLTHTDITRYFMTIPEAAQLVIQASAMASGGEVFLLDMGDPIRIYDLARKMVYLSGLTIKEEGLPYGDIEILVTGLRPGEKLYEELLIDGESIPTAHSKIMKTSENFLLMPEFIACIDELANSIRNRDRSEIAFNLKKLVPGYSSNNKNS